MPTDYVTGLNYRLVTGGVVINALSPNTNNIYGNSYALSRRANGNGGVLTIPATVSESDTGIPNYVVVGIEYRNTPNNIRSNTNIYSVVFQNPSSIRSIGRDTFYNCTNLRSIDLSNTGLISIGYGDFLGGGAFANTALTSITLPSSLRTLDNYAFGSCSSLQVVTFAGALQATGYSFNAGAFYDTSCTLNTTADVTTWSTYNSSSGGATGFTGLLVVQAPPSAPTITATPINGGLSVAFSAGTGSPVTGYKYRLDGTGSWLDTSTTSSPIVITGLAKKSYTVEIKAVSNGVDGLPSESTATPKYLDFSVSDGNATITGLGDYDLGINGVLTIPNTVSNAGGTYTVVGIADYNSPSSPVFFNNPNIYSVVFENTSSVTSIGSTAFGSCSNLTSISLPSTLESIGNNAFRVCTNITSIDLSNTKLVAIGDSVFNSCTSLSSITLPDSLTSIGLSSFDSCISLISITLPNILTSIGVAAFTKCTSLTSIRLPSLLTYIGYIAFQACPALQSVIIEGGYNSGYDVTAFDDAQIVVPANGVVKTPNPMTTFTTSTRAIWLNWRDNAPGGVGYFTGRTLTDPNRAPEITSGYTATFAENGTGTVYTVVASDPDAGSTLTYSISGVDADKFSIDSSKGEVTFNNPPNFEAPTDADGNNVYEITVSASDGIVSASRAVSITVTDEIEAPPAPTASDQSGYTGIYPENLVVTGMPNAQFHWYSGSTVAGGYVMIINTSGTYCVTQVLNGVESQPTVITITVQPLPLPNATSAQTFKAGAHVSDLVVTPTVPGGSIVWATEDYNVVGAGIELLNNTVYYAKQTYNYTYGGVESFSRLPVTVTLVSPPTADPQQFAYDAGAKVSDLAASGLDLKWYVSADPTTSSTPLPDNTSLITQTYYVSQTVSTIESNRTPVSVTITLPPAPTASDQTLPAGSTVADLVANGANLKWYDASTSGSQLVDTTTLVTGVTYYVSQTLYGFESSARTSVLVTLVSPPTASDQTLRNIIEGSAATVANLVANGANLKWYATSTDGSQLVGTTTLVTGVTYYVSQTVNGVESARASVLVTLVSAPTVSNQTLPAGSTVADLLPNGANITWYKGLTMQLSGDLLVNNGQYSATQTVNDVESNKSQAVTVTVSASAPSNIVCFAEGTRVLTQNGYKAIEALKNSDLLVTADGRIIDFQLLKTTLQTTTERTAPYLIQPHAFGRNLPSAPIRLSASHKIQLRKGLWTSAEKAVLSNPLVKQCAIGGPVTYYHIECEDYLKDDIVTEGLVVESLGTVKATGGRSDIYTWNSRLNAYTRIANLENGKSSKTL